MARNRMAGTRAALGPAALVGMAALVACSTPAATAPAPASTAAAAAEAPATRDPTAACAALAVFDGVTVGYPGGDPGAPPPSAEDLEQWGTTAAVPIRDLVSTVPAELDAAAGTLRDAVQGAQQGTAIRSDDPTINGASVALDKWGYDSCGFTQLDVVGTGTELSGVPASLPAGPVSVSFTNTGPPDRAGFVALVVRVKDGADYTIDGIRDGSVDVDSVGDVVAAAAPTQATPTAYTHATLDPGRFLVVSPVGTPPQFSGTLATEVTVN